MGKPLTNIFQLMTALAKATSGETISLSPGIYVIPSALEIADGVALEGPGKMLLDSEGRPKRLVGGARLVAGAGVSSGTDLVTLGDGARVSGISVEDFPGREGNLIAIGSRGPNDSISALIEECLLDNPNQAAMRRGGPIGRGLLVLSRNPFGSDPPHVGSRVSATMRRTIIRSPNEGCGVFAVNFAPQAWTSVRLERNVIGGGLDSVGGVSRPDRVTGSFMIITSDRNIYRSDGGVDRKNRARSGIGWSLRGGSNAPSPLFASVSTDNNCLVMISTGDRIVDCLVGVHASGGWRPLDQPNPGPPVGPVPGPVNKNRAMLSFTDTVFRCGATDVALFGAESDVEGGPGFDPGDDNFLSVTLQGVKPSGIRSNYYADAANYDGASLPPAAASSGNRLEISGPMTLVPGPPATTIKI